MNTTYAQAMGKRWRFPNLRKRLVGAWCPSLGVQGTSLYDLSGYNQTGTFNVLTASAWQQVNGLWTINQTGTANQRINIANNAALALQNGDYTISVWAMIPSAQTYSGIVVLNGCGVITESGATPNFTFMHASTGLRKTTITTAIMNHVCVTRTGTTYGMYVNGIDTSSVISDAGFGLNSVYAFGQGYTSAFQLNGNYDDVLAYTRVLTNKEIQLLYYGGPGIAHAQENNVRYAPPASATSGRLLRLRRQRAAT
jgi:Concanavalin A-like lectin/glucanases superfamily